MQQIMLRALANSSTETEVIGDSAPVSSLRPWTETSVEPTPPDLPVDRLQRRNGRWCVWAATRREPPADLSPDNAASVSMYQSNADPRRYSWQSITAHQHAAVDRILDARSPEPHSEEIDAEQTLQCQWSPACVLQPDGTNRQQWYEWVEGPSPVANIGSPAADSCRRPADPRPHDSHTSLNPGLTRWRSKVEQRWPELPRVIQHTSDVCLVNAEQLLRPRKQKQNRYPGLGYDPAGEPSPSIRDGNDFPSRGPAVGFPVLERDPTTLPELQGEPSHDGSGRKWIPNSLPAQWRPHGTADWALSRIRRFIQKRADQARQGHSTWVQAETQKPTTALVASASISGAHDQCKAGRHDTVYSKQHRCPSCDGTTARCRVCRWWACDNPACPSTVPVALW